MVAYQSDMAMAMPRVNRHELRLESVRKGSQGLHRVKMKACITRR